MMYQRYESPKTRMGLKNKIEEIEKDEIIKALQECRWIKIKAAKKLGITERMIGYKIKKYGIRKGGDEGYERWK